MSQNLPEAETFRSTLLHILKALNNEKALLVLLVTALLLTVALALLAYASVGSGFSVTTGFFFFLILLALPAGISVSGLLLMDQARGQTPRPIGKAVPEGIFTLFRILGIMLAGAASMAIFYLFLALLLLLCKLPAVGPVLYAVLLPMLKILGGALFFGLVAGLSMAAPAVWSGMAPRETLELLRRVAARRPLELSVSLFLLATFIALTGAILAGVLFVGDQLIQGISAFILDDSLRDPLSVFTLAENGVGLLAFFHSASDYKLATLFGFITGLMLILTALTAMTLMGINLIYLRITRNLPQAPADVRDPGLAETELTCPRCQTQAQPSDRYCGACGNPLRD